MSYKVGFLSLGCSKNKVDLEVMLFCLKESGYNIVNNIYDSDIVIVNTCGFIEDSKKESIDEILNVINLKQQGKIKSIIVTGCLAERYNTEVVKEFPEVDAVIGIGANLDISNVVANTLVGNKISKFPTKLELPLNGGRFLTTPKHYAYIKIAEGCDNKCTYCAIPIIRGPFRSRKVEDILKEANLLAESGIKELILVAQDTTRYGEDIYGKLMLPYLLKELCKIEKIKWIRVLYCYPDRLTDELIEVISNEPKIVKYIDLPLQHCNEKILKAMNRKGNRNSLTELIKKIRNRIPNVTLRTTFICGFPGETEEAFNELAEFSKDISFDRMGCFAYSNEEDTAASMMNNQIDEKIKLHRQEILMNEQNKIMEILANNMVGKEVTVLVEGYNKEENYYFGRSQADAPDVDGRVIFFAEQNPLIEGNFINVKITKFNYVDLIGEMVGVNNELA